MRVSADTIYANVGKNLVQTLFILFLGVLFILWWIKTPVYGRTISDSEMTVFATLGYVILTYSLLMQSKRYQDYKEMPMLEHRADKFNASDEFSVRVSNHTKDIFAKNLEIKCIILPYENKTRNKILWFFLKILNLSESEGYKKYYHIIEEPCVKSTTYFSLHEFLQSHFNMPYGKQDPKDTSDDISGPHMYSPKRYFPEEPTHFRFYARMTYESMLDTKSDPQIQDSIFEVTKTSFKEVSIAALK